VVVPKPSPVTKQFSSVWTRAPRQPKTAGLGRDQIVAAAVELLDADGLAAFSMRKLGAKLDAGATSLYWHVKNKDELLELAFDQFWGLVTVPDPAETPWRELATTFAYNLRVTLLAHPWAAALIGRMPGIGPNAFAMSDQLRRTFSGAGFTGLDTYLAGNTVLSYIFGQVIPEITSAEFFESGYDHESMLDTMDQVAADYPELLADYRNSLPVEPQVVRAMAFDFGLLCVLDGLAARLAGQRAAPADT
jgi:AcrR family transcriptional regulator